MSGTASRTAIEERGLILQMLRERAAAALRLADKHKADPDALLSDRARQLEVIIGDIEAGLHVPPAPDVEAAVPDGELVR